MPSLLDIINNYDINIWELYSTYIHLTSLKGIKKFINPYCSKSAKTDIYIWFDKVLI